jgi:hypothetical protein
VEQLRTPVDAVPGEQWRRVRAYEGEVVLQDAIVEGERGLAVGHVKRELQTALDGVRVVPAVQVHAENAACLRLHEYPPPPHRHQDLLELLGLVRPGHPKALFVCIGLHPESFQLIKVYIN